MKESRMGGFFKKIGDVTSSVGRTFKGKTIVNSNLDENQNRIITRLTSIATDSFRNIDGFVVKDYEHVVLLHQGSIVGIADSGIFELQKKSKSPGTEIIWITKREIEIKWGSPSVYTADQALIGCYGSARVRIVNPRSFVKNVIADQAKYDLKELKSWIKHTLISTIKTALSNYNLSELYSKRKSISLKVRREINPEFTRWGLELLTLDILGLKIPKEHQTLLKTDEDADEKERLQALLQKYEELIEKADEKLLSGEISEERHSEIVKRYQKKIQELKGSV